jgi:NAD(P)-dependent dehydrogenase (short-subunit alcohol dehydrogenase family)
MNIVILGATQGLGLELAKIFASSGHKVAAGTVEQETPASLAAIEGVFVFPSDVSNEEQVKAGAKKCLEFFGGKVDALCNVAGVLLPGDRVNQIQDLDVSDLRKSFEVNAIGAIIAAKSFYPAIKEGGRVFTVTSEGTGLQSCGTWIPCYALSKTAATKVSGIFNASVKDVDFYSVHPGRMNTEMGRSTAQIEASESAAWLLRVIAGDIPISRDNWYINYKGEPMGML